MQNNIIDMDQLKQNLEFMKHIYDAVRIVHPIRKKVIDFHGNQSEEKEFHCFEIWAQGKMCNNCISIRTYLQKEIQFKLEHAQGKIFMVMTIPVRSDGELLVLELIKDITHHLVVESFLADSEHPLLKLLNDTGELQIRDALTGLFNRRFIDERLPVDIYNCNKDSKLLSIILADIDRFKGVNDTYGHIAGDHILKEFAQHLHDIIQNDGWVARYGGEEFLIVLSNTDINKAEAIAEKIRKKVEDSKFVYKSDVIKITSSFGVCTLGYSQDITAETLIEYVDKNLYQAKNLGRNRVAASKME